MTRTHKKPGNDPTNRLTGSAAHEHDHHEQQQHDEQQRYDEQDDPRDADPREVGMILAEADAAASDDRVPDPFLDDAPTAAIGRASVPPVVYPPPSSTDYLSSTHPSGPSGAAPVGAAAARIESPVEPPPIESYEQLLGGLGERPYDSPRPLTPEAAWGRSLRHFARAAVWTLPVSAVCVALSGMWGWPTRTAEPSGESPGTWLVVTMAGLVLGLAGVLAMTALLSSTPGRRWSLAALSLVLTGTVLLAPVLGVLALARPAVSRLSDRLGPDTAADLEARFFDNTISRWLGLGGLALLAAGWLAFGCAVLAARVLNRVDGYLVLCAVVIGVVAAYLSWQFLITIGAMVLLAAGLGLAWTAARLTPDGRTPVDD